MLKDINTLKDYQDAALESAIYPRDLVIPGTAIAIYPALKLAGEAGEVAEKIGKAIRDGVKDKDVDKWTAELAKELGDVLWYVTAMAREIDYPLRQIGQMNIDKLHSRMNRGVLQGDGDNR